MLEDHDLLAERTLTSLGSAPPLCLEILDAWRSIRGTEQLGNLMLRDAPLSAEQLAARRMQHEHEVDALQKSIRAQCPPAWRPRVRRAFESRRRGAAQRLELEEHLWALTVLETLPLSLRRILALSVLVHAARRWHLEGFRRERTNHVEAALIELALPLLEQSARAWRRNLRPYSFVDLELWLRAPREAPTCTAWLDGAGGHGALSLPLSWFTDVWARGVALVDGCFVLELMQAPRHWTRLDVLALRWERRGRDASRAVTAPALLTQRWEGDWRLAWPGWDAAA